MAEQWNELLTVKSPRQQLDALLLALRNRGWPTTAWQPGDVGRTLVEIAAEVLSDLSKTAVNVAKSGFLDTAEGQWLDWMAEQFYSLARSPGTFCERKLRISVAATAPFLTQDAGKIVVSDATGKYRFQNRSSVSVAPGSFSDVVFRAEGAGVAYNTVTPTILNLAIPGVSVSIPPGDDTVTVFGNDRETDVALRRRCRNMFPVQGTGATGASYEHWALEASEEVRRVQALPPTGDGVVHLRIASDSAGVSSAATEAVREYIEARQPLTAALDLLAATPVTVNVVATIHAPAQHLENAKTEAEANLAALLKTLPIGAGGTVYRSALIEQLMAPIGVVNAVLTSPAADVPIVDGQVAQIGTVNITTMAVG
jgi:uncharacterized phage protein gp47/JayE